MDPVTVIVCAFAAGAAALGKGAVEGLTEAAKNAISDAYNALKSRLVAYKSVDIIAVENRPDSEYQRASLAKNLTEANAADDLNLLSAARKLLLQVQGHESQVGAAIGVDLKRVSGAALRIQSVESEGTGVRVQDGTFSGDIEIGNVRSGRSTVPRNPPMR